MSQVKENIKQLLRELTDLVAVSGQEQEMIKALSAHLQPYVDKLEVDTTGNLTAIKKGARPGPALILAAHMDQIGFVVRAILPNGFLLIDAIGGVPDNTLPAKKVWVTARKIPGVIGSKPGHLQTAEEAGRVKPVGQSYVDLGARSAEEVQSLGVKVGDQVVMQSDFMEMANPDLICTKAVDDRIGCALLVELLRNLKSEDFGGTVYAVFTVKEEVGQFGAQTVATRLQPDYALILDTVPAGDSPEIKTEVDLPIRLGGGPGLLLSSKSRLGSWYMVHPALHAIINEQALSAGISLQPCTILNASYSTDADKISYAGSGVPTAVLNVPRRYSHSPAEVVDLNDAVDLYHLVERIIRYNEKAQISFI